MADKKITELTELSTAKQGDLLVVVDNPAGTPITKKITVTNLFANVTYLTPSTDTAATIANPFKVSVTSNLVYTGAASVIGGQFFANAVSTATNTAYQYAATFTSRLNANTSAVTVEHAAAKFTVDVCNAAALIANTYGIIVGFANTVGTRTQNTQAFMALTEPAAGAYTTSTVYLLEGKNLTANTNAASGNLTVMFSNTAATATHKLRVRINGADYYVLLASNGSGGVAV